MPVQTQVLVLLAEPVQLDLQLLDSMPLGFQKLLLALDDVVEFKKVLHGPVRAFGVALAWALISIHDFSGLKRVQREGSIAAGKRPRDRGSLVLN